ncbi:MAG: sensor histidine kinase [Thermoguttaceae bacterium]
MARREFPVRGSRDPQWWPLLALLLAVVLLPTACLLWMMSRAIDNERRAVQQILSEACRSHFVRLQGHWDEHWQARAKQLDDAAAGKPPPEAFAEIVRAGLADSAIVCDDRRRPAYPALPVSPAKQAVDDAAWNQAEQLEYVAQKPPEAAEAYAAIAKNAADADVAARAILAQARCLARAGRRAVAIDLYANTLAGERFARATDADGRLIAADSELRALELIDDPSDVQFQAVASRLVHRLVDYSAPLLGSSQRRFLINSLAGRVGFRPASDTSLAAENGATHTNPKGQRENGSASSLTLRVNVSGNGEHNSTDSLFALQDGEELAAAVLESGMVLASKPVVQPGGVPDVWQFASASGHVVPLFRTATILRELQTLAAAEGLPAGADVELLPPDRTADPSNFLSMLPAGDRLPGWQLALRWNDEALAGQAARGKIVAYWFVGILAVVAGAVLAFWIAMSLLRQMRLARLKNDLVAAVSHELKTPLASMRLLIDTLLADDEPDRRRLREYLELVAKENARLTRLIDNFLTYSRMERHKHSFTPSEIAPADVVAAAADAIGERYHQGGCSLQVGVEPGLPSIMADSDAMTTALVNLLDNAYKYTEDDKQISLRAKADGSWVLFEVTDNGIGLSRAACRRVFERFYQVDRELSRSRGGCGLGLSIVAFIAKEHGGRVAVHSRPGHGSTFSIALPPVADGAGKAMQRETL